MAAKNCKLNHSVFRAYATEFQSFTSTMMPGSTVNNQAAWIR